MSDTCDLPGSSVHGILQAKILEWVAISFSSRFPWGPQVAPNSDFVSRAQCCCYDIQSPTPFPMCSLPFFLLWSWTCQILCSELGLQWTVILSTLLWEKRDTNSTFDVRTMLVIGFLNAEAWTSIWGKIAGDWIGEERKLGWERAHEEVHWLFQMMLCCLWNKYILWTRAIFSEFFWKQGCIFFLTACLFLTCPLWGYFSVCPDVSG